MLVLISVTPHTATFVRVQTYDEVGRYECVIFSFPQVLKMVVLVDLCWSSNEKQSTPIYYLVVSSVNPLYCGVLIAFFLCCSTFPIDHLLSLVL